MNGVLVIDKPGGRTSFSIVRQLRRLLKVRKVGHAGTLDPMATGVLPICLGEATKAATFLLHSDKEYVAGVLLGAQTDTDDADGEVVATAEVPAAASDAGHVAAVLARFEGSGRQRPPGYSAIKVRGRRSYQRARAGEVVELPERDVVVHRLELGGIDGARIDLTVRAAKGFYVRALARDLGVALGTRAHLVALRRVRSGPFAIEQAAGIEELERLVRRGERLPLISCADALCDLPAFQLDAATADNVRKGQRPRRDQVPIAGHSESGYLRLLDPSGALAAVARDDPSTPEHALLELARVFNARR